MDFFVCDRMEWTEAPLQENTNDGKGSSKIYQESHFNEPSVANDETRQRGLDLMSSMKEFGTHPRRICLMDGGPIVLAVSQ